MNSRESDAPEATRAWLLRRERGNRASLAFIRWVALGLGRRPARFALGFAVAWYLLRAWPLRRHVYDFLRRVSPRPPRLRDFVRSYWTFGAVTLDRVFLLAGRDAGFDIRAHDAEILHDMHARGQGAILLGAHLGSFASIRALGMRREKLPISILQYTDQNPHITRMLAALDPALAASIIPLGAPDVLLRLAERIEAGDFVAMLADRIAPTDTRSVACEFLGGRVRFPSGGVEAALLLGCPVVFFLGLYRGGNRYDIHFEQLSAGECVARGERAAAAERLMQAYAGRLAHYARLAPYNWFNFYDYWG
ncbi:MAG: lipid A biosynthesis acyltransferase [Gammaproteobacteria bacterium]